MTKTPVEETWPGSLPPSALAGDGAAGPLASFPERIGPYAVEGLIGHGGMAAGETGVEGDAVLGPHPRIPHDPKKLGCVICHGGQGRATVKADAHGTAPHWPSPMIPRKYAHAGCGSCHTHLTVPAAATMSEGARPLERHDCLACHNLDGRGGTTRPGRTDKANGPDLSGVGASGRLDGWYARHLKKKASSLLAEA